MLILKAFESLFLRPNPLRSRLDTVFTTASKLALVNANTIYGQNNTTNACHVINASLNIPSYNQALTALRALGLLNAVCKKLQVLADAQNNNTPDTGLATVLQGILNTATTKVQTTTANASVTPNITDSYFNQADFNTLITPQ